MVQEILTTDTHLSVIFVGLELLEPEPGSPKGAEKIHAHDCPSHAVISVSCVCVAPGAVCVPRHPSTCHDKPVGYGFPLTSLQDCPHISHTCPRTRRSALCVVKVHSFTIMGGARQRPSSATAPDPEPSNAKPKAARMRRERKVRVRALRRRPSLYFQLLLLHDLQYRVPRAKRT
jgi:hypothetical protein